MLVAKNRIISFPGVLRIHSKRQSSPWPPIVLHLSRDACFKTPSWYLVFSSVFSFRCSTIFVHVQNPKMYRQTASYQHPRCQTWIEHHGCKEPIYLQGKPRKKQPHPPVQFHGRVCCCLLLQGVAFGITWSISKKKRREVLFSRNWFLAILIMPTFNQLSLLLLFICMNLNCGWWARWKA